MGLLLLVSVWLHWTAPRYVPSPSACDSLSLDLEGPTTFRIERERRGETFWSLVGTSGPWTPGQQCSTQVDLTGCSPCGFRAQTVDIAGNVACGFGNVATRWELTPPVGVPPISARPETL